MDDVIAARLKSRMGKLGLSALELARQAGVRPSFIYDILNGKSANPSTVRLARVAEKLGISIGYLAGQEEEPAPLPAESPHYAAIPTLAVRNGEVATVAVEGEPYYFHRAWIRDRLGATPENIRLLFVMEDGMVPSLHLGDMVLIDLTKRLPSPPGIFALFDGMGLTVRRLELIAESGGGAVRISSDNAQYETAQQPLNDIRVIGRVVWFAREM